MAELESEREHDLIKASDFDFVIILGSSGGFFEWFDYVFWRIWREVDRLGCIVGK